MVHEFLDLAISTDLGLLCHTGVVKPGKHPENAALRKVKEETGLVLELLPDVPFVGFDTVGEVVVLTYKAKVIGGELIATAHNNGTPF